MSASALRQVLISRMIPMEPGRITVADLHSCLKSRGILVSRRTVQRDLNDLSTILDMQCHYNGRARYWYIINREQGSVCRL